MSEHDVTLTPPSEDLRLDGTPVRKRRGRRPGAPARQAISRELPRNVWIVYMPFRDDSLAPPKATVHVIGATGDSVKALDWIEENPGAEVLSAVIEP